MMKQLIKANPEFTKKIPLNEELFLNVSEFFCDSIQGEGISTGYPAAFLRLQYCTLNCKYCDTKSIRDNGNPYIYTEIFDLMALNKLGTKVFEPNLVTKLKQGQHLVITGGSPLGQQEQLIGFLQTFIKEFGFKPFIELENECTIIPEKEIFRWIDQWNNSPKLSNSGNPRLERYKPIIIRILSNTDNSWFKFVICNPKEDWQEIVTDFIKSELILREQIILMPQGKTRKEILKNSPAVIELAVKENVRFSLREHIILWDNKIGV